MRVRKMLLMLMLLMLMLLLQALPLRYRLLSENHLSQILHCCGEKRLSQSEKTKHFAEN